MQVAVTRAVSPAIGECELTHLERAPIDFNLAQAQHATYEETLRSLGYLVKQLPAEPTLPDSVFVEDVAVVLDEVAVITRPGARSRRNERMTIERSLDPYRPIARVLYPGIIDGGDVLVSGRDIWIGISSRTNNAGIDQFRAAVSDYSYQVRAVQVRDCLHLKSAATPVGENALLVNPSWVDMDSFADRDCLIVDPSEPGAANIIRTNDTVITAASFPLTGERLNKAGFNVCTIDVSELAKAEGALSCCSLLFDTLRP